MPYLRLYLPKVPIEQKRLIAQRLIEITLHTFHLPARERANVSIQFISLPQAPAANDVRPATVRGADIFLEVLGHDLTEGKKSAFSEEAAAMLSQLTPLSPKSRIARLLRINPEIPRRIAFQFDELSPAISEPLVVYAGPRAA